MFEVLSDVHREPDDSWEQKLREFILEELVLVKDVYPEYYLDTQDKANSLLMRVTATGTGIDESTLCELRKEIHTVHL